MVVVSSVLLDTRPAVLGQPAGRVGTVVRGELGKGTSWTAGQRSPTQGRATNCNEVGLRPLKAANLVK
jgi:hypothetical protein